MTIKQTRAYNLNIITFHLFKQSDDNNLPVHLKYGKRDKILYWTVLIFALYNTTQAFRRVKHWLKFQ